MPKFTVAPPVKMDDVPDPEVSRAPRGQCEPVFEQIASLKRNQALPLTFKASKDGLAVRGALRKIAKRKGEILSSSYTPDRLTFFFWLEPKA